MRTRRVHRRNHDLPGHAHELTFSCYRRFPFLASDRTCQWFVDELNTAREKLRFSLWAYVIMPEHVHLIVHPSAGWQKMSAVRSGIKLPVSRKAIAYLEENAPEWLPRITRKRGDRVEGLFWQSGGGYDRNVTEAATLAAMIEYIHQNPVRRGLVERAEDWKWSSAAWFAGQTDVPIVPDAIPWSRMVRDSREIRRLHRPSAVTISRPGAARRVTLHVANWRATPALRTEP